MATIGDLVQRLLPEGSRPYERRKSWLKCPEWPPDVFAVASTLLERSGIYALDRYSGRIGARGLFGSKFRDDVRGAADRWEETVTVPPAVQKDWRAMVAEWDTPLDQLCRQASQWGDAVVRLVAITDELCVGFGFHHEKKRVFADFVFNAYHAFYTKKRHLPLPFLPVSLCLWVTPHEVCVQPKTRTSQVGCNARCLTHNLALLPPAHEVETEWNVAHPAGSRDSAPLNVLVVPFPYTVSGNAFVARRRLDDESDSAHFALKQLWLDPRRGVSTTKLASFVRGLLRQAREEVDRVHAIVFPELALNVEVARGIAERLAASDDVELFIAGVLEKGRCPRNRVYCASFSEGEMLYEWYQSKHHRWLLDGPQIRRYHLGHRLDPALRWWEELDVAGRTVKFTVIRPGMSIAALVCEDLARADPVHPALRAVGPNLVVCLLMDGPQREARWPGRYATGLAEDPGSAVLTVTCLGMVRRSSDPEAPAGRHVALWKEAGGPARELSLPRDDHALLLTLTPSNEENWTLDGRSDGGTSVSLSLGAVHALRHPAPPVWAR